MNMFLSCSFVVNSLMLAILTIFISACGEGGGSDSSNTGSPGSTNDFKSVTLTPVGGTYQFDNGISIEIPAGAVAENLVLKARIVNPTEVQTIFDKNQGVNPKAVLSGIEFEPKEFKFLQPVSLTVQADRFISPTELPLLYIVDHEHQISTLDTSFVSSPPVLKPTLQNKLFPAKSVNKVTTYPTKFIEADCENNKFVLVNLDSLPAEQKSLVIAAVDNMRKHLGEACKACKFTMEVREWDYSADQGSAGSCYNVGSVGRVTYHECPQPNTETWDMTETSVGRILLNPDKIEMGRGDSTAVTSMVLDAAGHVLSDYYEIQRIETSDSSVATFELNSNSGGSYDWFRVYAGQSGTATITETYQCNISARLPVVVRDFAVTPGNLCVEKNQTADFSVIAYSEAVNLSAVTWSSSDTSVATVNDTGVVNAVGVGPVKITAATNVYQNGEIDHLEASATVEVKDSCVFIKPKDSGPASICIAAPDSSIFEPLDDTRDLEISISTPQQGFGLYWESSEQNVATVARKDELTSTVTSVSNGTAEIQVTVDNIVTQYTSTIPVTVKEIADDYTSAWLTLPWDQNAILTDNRDVLSESQYTDFILEAEERCNVNLDPNDYGATYYTGFNLKGQLIGYGEMLYNSYYIQGFIFDTVECTLEIIDPPIATPLGKMDNIKHTFPMAINEDGTVVGYVHWDVYDPLYEDDPATRGVYHLETAFIYEHGIHSYPLLVPVDPGIEDFEIINDIVNTGFSDINNNRIALAWEGNADYLYNIDNPFGSVVIDVGNQTWSTLNDYERVVSYGYHDMFSNGNIFNIPLNFSTVNASAPQVSIINNSDDILGIDNLFTSSSKKYFVNYLCPFPVESGTALWMEDPALLEGYEVTEVSCDGRDNDLDGLIDAGLTAPLTTKQAGVCAGKVKVCRGAAGWVDDYSDIPNYHFPESSSSCDELDNDCDGITDEECN